mgnify:CR=1 FL=1
MVPFFILPFIKTDFKYNFTLKGITSISSDKVCVFIGKRETGKSFLVKDLLYYHRSVPIGTVISGTEAANTFYGDMVPSLFIHDAYTPEIVANTLKRQKLVVKKKSYGKYEPKIFLKKFELFELTFVFVLKKTRVDWIYERWTKIYTII